MRRADLSAEARAAIEVPWRETSPAPRRDAAPLFESNLLDRFTRVHPWTPYLVGAPLALLSIARARSIGPLEITALVLAGWLLWTLVEYLMHRFLFHMRGQSEGLRIALLLAHGHHHVWPDDRRRIAATLVQLGSLLLLFHGVTTLTLGEARGAAVFAGVVIGYVVYEAVHFMAHHGKPRSRLLRALKEHHMRHHHVTPRARWGISSPLWDWIFRTTGDP